MPTGEGPLKTCLGKGLPGASPFEMLECQLLAVMESVWMEAAETLVL